MDRASAQVLCITTCSNLTSVGVLLSARHHAGPNMTLSCRRSGASLSVKVLDFVQFRGLFERSGVEFEPIREAHGQCYLRGLQWAVSPGAPEIKYRWKALCRTCNLGVDTTIGMNP